VVEEVSEEERLELVEVRYVSDDLELEDVVELENVAEKLLELEIKGAKIMVSIQSFCDLPLPKLTCCRISSSSERC
jgi:hypothetical protein